MEGMFRAGRITNVNRTTANTYNVSFQARMIARIRIKREARGDATHVIRTTIIRQNVPRLAIFGTRHFGGRTRELSISFLRVHFKRHYKE